MRKRTIRRDRGDGQEGKWRQASETGRDVMELMCSAGDFSIYDVVWSNHREKFMAKSAGAGKPIVFISHLSEEKEAAIALKELLEKHLSSHARFFVSSDDVSIGKGETWLASVSRHLKVCVAEIIMCSPTASKRDWIHFEAGAGWIRDIPVIPVCIAGMTARNLPDTLRHLQAVDARKKNEVCGLVRDIGLAAGHRLKRIECDEFVAAMETLEARAASGPVFPKLYQVSADIQADLPGMIRSAKKTMVMCGIHFNISLANRFVDYVGALGAGVSLTMCATKPESKAVEHLAEFSGEAAEQLRSECQVTYAFFNRLKDAHREKVKSAGTKSRLVLQLSTVPPAARVYVFDHETPQGQMLFTPYLRMRDSTQCPTLLFHASHSVFSAFVEATMRQVQGNEVFYDSRAG